MNYDEILQAAKEAGLLHKDAQTASQIVFDFAAIIEKRTIERCAVVCEMLRDLQLYADKQEAQNDCAAAIRKLGEQ